MQLSMARRDQTQEKAAVLAVINALSAVGWKPYGISELVEPEDLSTTEALMALIFDMDDSHVLFRKILSEETGKTERRAWVYFVLGNADDGTEVVCDHTLPEGHDEFEKAINTAVDNHESLLCKHQWEEQPGEPPRDVCTSCGRVRE